MPLPTVIPLLNINDAISVAFVDNTKTNIDYLDTALETGWVPLGAVLTYGTTDGHTFTVTAPVDLTALVGVGMRIQVTHAVAVKYFIVTAISFAAGTTTITLYGGTNYTLAAGAITLPSFSPFKAPLGFPLDRALWTEVVTGSGSQASAVLGTWYNLGGVNIPLPIGAWDVDWSADCNHDVVFTATGNTYYGIAASLSTGAAAESDTQLTAKHSKYGNENSGASGSNYQTHSRRKALVVAVKTLYYLIAKFDVTLNAGTATVIFANARIAATCAYL